MGWCALESLCECRVSLPRRLAANTVFLFCVLHHIDRGLLGDFVVKRCICGRFKDRRSSQCSICAGRGFAVGQKTLGSNRYLKDVALDAISRATSFSRAAEILGCSKQTVGRLVKVYEAPTDHMKRARGRLPKDQHIFKIGDKRRNSTVKKYVLDNNLIPYVCGSCGQAPEWNGKTLVLQLDHADGDATNDVKENLGFLCPNCHSQTETFCGRNV